MQPYNGQSVIVDNIPGEVIDFNDTEELAIVSTHEGNLFVKFEDLKIDPKQDFTDLADKIADEYDYDQAYRREVNESPEFYRALIWNSKFLETDLDDFDGTEDYHRLVDELEEIFASEPV